MAELAVVPTIKLLSLWEPWATLMALGAKRIETRGWYTSYRGWLAIQASNGGLPINKLRQTVADSVFWSALGFDKKIQPIDWRESFPFGKIVALVNLVDVLPTESRGCCDSEIFENYREMDTPQERAFGNYAPGRFGFVTENLMRLPEPIPFKAMQRICNVPSYVTKQIWCSVVDQHKAG